LDHDISECDQVIRGSIENAPFSAKASKVLSTAVDIAHEKLVFFYRQ